jgi:glycosyltransferase involved in cell wall biosynthesis
MPSPASFRPVVIAPTYNNAGTLADVLEGIGRLGLPLIVVNDGATDATAAVLAGRAADRPPDRFRVLTHPRNRGKAAAMHTGFAAAADAGFTHAVTIDTDGQLDPAEIPLLLRAAEANPRALVVGVRTREPDGATARGTVGRLFSKSMIELECGVHLTDSQCGLRVYPTALVAAVACRSGRYGFETEIITRAAWAGFPVVGVPVSCRYFPRGRRVSHFRPWIDTTLIVLLHMRLMLTHLFFHDHSRTACPGKSTGAERTAAPPPAPPGTRSP